MSTWLFSSKLYEFKKKHLGFQSDATLLSLLQLISFGNPVVPDCLGVTVILFSCWTNRLDRQNVTLSNKQTSFHALLGYVPLDLCGALLWGWAGTQFVQVQSYMSSYEERPLSALQGPCCVQLSPRATICWVCSLGQVHNELQYVSRCPFLLTTAR